MFDWNDEELTNIVWGEGRETRENSDHIVPFPEGGEEKSRGAFETCNKKQWSNEDNSVNLAEQKKPGASNDFSGSKPENSTFNTDELGLEMDTWPDSPLPDAACAAGTVQLDNDPQLFEDEHGEKEHTDFLDYSWANIGSFDDLDSMFRNDDPIFGGDSLGSADDFWSSTANLIGSAGSSLRLGESKNTNQLYENKTENVRHEDHSTGYERISDSSTHIVNSVEDSTKNKGYGTDCSSSALPVVDSVGGKRKSLMDKKKDTKMIGKMASNSQPYSEKGPTENVFASKVNDKKDPLKCPKREEESERKSQDSRGPWSLNTSQFQHFSPQMPMSSTQTFPSSILNPHRQLGPPHSWMYLQNLHPYSSTGYDHATNYYPTVPTSPCVNPKRVKDQSHFVGYKFSPLSSKHVNSSKKFPGGPSRPTNMTPREKIEKLRRRQQMQAMLAIQEQQEQFGHQVIETDSSGTQICPQENPSQDTEVSGVEVEENNKLPSSLESNPPMEQDDPNTNAMSIDDCSFQERVLDQLQDVVKKLDVNARLCIRDSLLRLAQSATQRHNSNDTSSDKPEILINDETEGPNRSVRIPDLEKDTNPIDRTVAHLLFYRPLESSTKPLKDGQLPQYSNLMFKPRLEGFVNLKAECLFDDSTEKNQLQNITNPENLLTNAGPEDDGTSMRDIGAPN